MDNDIISKIKQILLNDPEVKEKWDDLTHITSLGDALKSFKLLYFFITKLVYVIEVIQAQYSGMSQDERIDYAAKTLDDLIQFKGWAIFMEPFDYMFFKFVISQVVAGLDSKYGTGHWFNNETAKASLDSGNHLANAAAKVL